MKYYESQLNFFQKQTLEHVNVTLYNSFISEFFLDTNMIYQRSSYYYFFFSYLLSGHGVKTYESFFSDALKVS